MQMDLPMWALQCLAIVAIVLLLAPACTSLLITVPTFAVAGTYCLDMCLAVLESFQTYFDFRTPRSLFLSKAVHMVHLIHPVVVVGCTSVFVAVYNITAEQPIKFNFAGEGRIALLGPDNGGAILAVGWLAVNVLSHASVWPLAWSVHELPGLRPIL